MAILAIGVFVWFVTIVLSWLKLWTRKRSARALGFQSWWNDYRALQCRTLFPTACIIRRAGAQPDGISVSKAFLREPLHPVQEGNLDPWQRGKCLNVHVMLQWCKIYTKWQYLAICFCLIIFPDWIYDECLVFASLPLIIKCSLSFYIKSVMHVIQLFYFIHRHWPNFLFSVPQIYPLF